MFFSLKDLDMFILMYLEKRKAEIQATPQPWSPAVEEMVCTLSRGRGTIQECIPDGPMSLLSVGLQRKALFRDFLSDLQWCTSQILNSESPEQMQGESYADIEGRSLLDVLMQSYISCCCFQAADPQQNNRLSDLTAQGSNVVGSNYGNAHKIFPPELDLDGFPHELLSLLETLGWGVQGVVRVGEWLGDFFAVKILPIFCFETEMEVLINMRHPNVVEMKGYIRRSDLRPGEGEYEGLMLVEDEYCGLVMELMEKSLEGLIEEETEKQASKVPFSLLLSIDILLQIARGMRFLQVCGVMHRDLKPGNVLVKRIHDIPCGAGKQGYLIVKLSDFGLSKACVTEECGAEGLTYKAGTPFYVAPEARQEKVVFTKEADVFSFGTTCFNVVTGQFLNGASRVFYERIESGNAQEEYLSRCESPDLAGLIMECWSPDPAKRPTFSVLCGKLETMKRNTLLGHPLDYRVVLSKAPKVPRWKAVGEALAKHLEYFERVLECVLIGWNMIFEDGFTRWVNGEADVKLDLCTQDLAGKVGLVAKDTHWLLGLLVGWRSGVRLDAWVVLMDLCVELWKEVLGDPFQDTWELSDAGRELCLLHAFPMLGLLHTMDELEIRLDPHVLHHGRSLLSESRAMIKKHNSDLARLIRTTRGLSNEMFDKQAALKRLMSSEVPSARWTTGFCDSRYNRIVLGVAVDGIFFRTGLSVYVTEAELEISVGLVWSKFDILYGNRWESQVCRAVDEGCSSLVERLGTLCENRWKGREPLRCLREEGEAREKLLRVEREAREKLLRKEGEARERVREAREVWERLGETEELNRFGSDWFRERRDGCLEELELLRERETLREERKTLREEVKRLRETLREERAAKEREEIERVREERAAKEREERFREREREEREAKETEERLRESERKERKRESKEIERMRQEIGREEIQRQREERKRLRQREEIERLRREIERFREREEIERLREERDGIERIEEEEVRFREERWRFAKLREHIWSLRVEGEFTEERVGIMRLKAERDTLREEVERFREEREEIWREEREA